MARQFTPTKDNTRDFRDALGCFATGVTVVTAPTDNGGIGMTVNSFSSISLSPPLVLWSPSKLSLRYPFFRDSSHFAIHVLTASQKALALEFARRGDAFETLGTAHNDRGVPVFDTCLARFECATTDQYDAGDHAIMIGRVENAFINDGAPLVFSQSLYGTHAPES